GTPCVVGGSSPGHVGRGASLVADEPLPIGPGLPVLGGIHVGEVALLRGGTDAVAAVADLRAESLFLFLELLEERLGGSFGAQVGGEPVDRIPVAPVVLLGAGAVAGGIVGGGVCAHPVGQGLDEGGPAAAACPFQLLGRP